MKFFLYQMSIPYSTGPWLLYRILWLSTIIIAVELGQIRSITMKKTGLVVNEVITTHYSTFMTLAPIYFSTAKPKWPKMKKVISCIHCLDGFMKGETCNILSHECVNNVNDNIYYMLLILLDTRMIGTGGTFRYKIPKHYNGSI